MGNAATGGRETVMSDPASEPSLIGAAWAAASALFGAVLAFGGAHYWYGKAAKAHFDAETLDEKKKLMDRVTELEAQLRLVSQSMVPISTAFQAILVKELTHFHTPVMDALLVKLGPPFILTSEEEGQLLIKLAERAAEVGSLMTESERDAATILPMVIRRVKAEAALNVGELQLMATETGTAK